MVLRYLSQVRETILQLQGINLYRNDFFWNDFVSKWPVTEQQVAAACKRETSDWKLTWCVLEKLFVSTASCIIINNNLLFCAACSNNKILSQNAGKIFKEFLQYTQSDCGHNLPPSVWWTLTFRP